MNNSKTYLVTFKNCNDQICEYEVMARSMSAAGDEVMVKVDEAVKVISVDVLFI